MACRRARSTVAPCTREVKTTMDDQPLFRHVDELEEELAGKPATARLPDHEQRPDDALDGSVMSMGGTATETGTVTHDRPGDTTDETFLTPLSDRDDDAEPAER